MNYTRKDVPLFGDDQKPKDCKKQTPDYVAPNPQKGTKQIGFRMKDEVMVKGVSLVNGTELDGEYVFDSYDSYDNTCYVASNTGLTYNVLLTDVELLNSK